MITKISELSRKTGVSLRSLRYYEQQGILTPLRLENGYREFDESDVDCQTKSASSHLNPRVVVEFYERKLVEIKKQVDKLQTAEKFVQQQLLKWQDENAQQAIRVEEDLPEQGKHILQEELKMWKS